MRFDVWRGSVRGRKPATEINTTRTRPRQPKADAERKAAEVITGRVFALHGGEVAKPKEEEVAESTALATLAAVWGKP